MASHTSDGFGARLRALRRARGMTQSELGAATESSQRMISHYENSADARPPADVVRALATALQVSSDELLGLAPLPERVTSAHPAVRRAMKRVEELPPEDQKAVLRVVDALIDRRGERRRQT